jgi:hypothetical protein
LGIFRLKRGVGGGGIEDKKEDGGGLYLISPRFEVTAAAPSVVWLTLAYRLSKPS